MYEHLQSVPDVLPYIPRYYGRVDPITLGLPQDLPKGPHLSGCGLRLERINGQDEKIAHVAPPLLQQAEAVLERVNDLIARLDVWDASCFHPGSQAAFTLIDFGLAEDYGVLSDALEKQGALSEHVTTVFRLD